MNPISWLSDPSPGTLGGLSRWCENSLPNCQKQDNMFWWTSHPPKEKLNSYLTSQYLPHTDKPLTCTRVLPLRMTPIQVIEFTPWLTTACLHCANSLSEAFLSSPSLLVLYLLPWALPATILSYWLSLSSLSLRSYRERKKVRAEKPVWCVSLL